MLSSLLLVVVVIAVGIGCFTTTPFLIVLVFVVY